MLEVERVLKSKDIDYRLIELSDRALTVQDVMRFSKGDIAIDEICKTIIVKDETGSKYAFLLRGSDKIDFSKANRLIGKKLSIARSSEVKEATGVEPGAICPIVLKVPLYVDERVIKLNRINFGSGNHLYGIEMCTKDFLRLVPYEIGDIAA